MDNQESETGRYRDQVMVIFVTNSSFVTKSSYTYLLF